MTAIPKTGLQLQSVIKSSGELVLSLAEVAVPQPAADEVLIQVEGSPLNPSDLGLLLGPADLSTLADEGGITTARVHEKLLVMVAARLDKSMPVGNEGAGVVVAAGSDPAAQSATRQDRRGGRRGDVRAILRSEGGRCAGAAGRDHGGGRRVVLRQSARALGMVETMRREGHTALVHTAAASNLGQMLNKICISDGIALVNIVRSAEQAKILSNIGAKHVVDSTSPTFQAELTAALIETKAAIAFDAIGGGKLADQILVGMEAAANSNASAYSVYGSSVLKQVYIFGRMDRRPTELSSGDYGLTWAVGGWLLTNFLIKQRPEEAQRLRRRVGDFDLNGSAASISEFVEVRTRDRSSLNI